jgi:DNA-directed RNA polymerase specialized sigma24 family protein
VNLAAIDVRRILKCCKQNDRLVLQWHYLQGYKVQEIARKQGWTETAVRIRLLRARRTVGQRLGRKMADKSGRVLGNPGLATPKAAA